MTREQAYAEIRAALAAQPERPDFGRLAEFARANPCRACGGSLRDAGHEVRVSLDGDVLIVHSTCPRIEGTDES